MTLVRSLKSHDAFDGAFISLLPCDRANLPKVALMFKRDAKDGEDPKNWIRQYRYSDHQNTQNPMNCSFTGSAFLYMLQKHKNQLQQERVPSQWLRLKLLSLSPVSLNKAFICRFYCFLFVSQYVIKAGLHSDTAVSLMSLPGPLTAAQYNISGLRRYPDSP